ncbi:MAG: DinB family protein [Bacteroidetes bacterium]|nr:DinB family protein [Bacteroidota bacterium]
MLKHSLAACPAQHWDAKVGHSTIRQDAYHALFWCSYYLTRHEDQYQPSEYHKRGGNELEPVISTGLEKEDTLRFIEDTHDRIVRTIADETEGSMSGDCGFPSIFRNSPLSRLELHVYNIRHLQHHVGQINITLRHISDAEGLDLKLPWVGPGWG